MQNENNKQTVKQQDIIDALGGVPVIVPQTHQKKSPIPLFIAIGLSFIAIVTIVVLTLSPNQPQTASTGSSNLYAAQSTAAFQSIAGESSTIAGFTASVSLGEYTSAEDFIHVDSNIIPLSESVLEKLAGSDTDWSACSVVELETYREATLKVTASKTFEIIYIPVQCPTLVGTVREFEFDMRKVKDEEFKIFDIITRVL